MINPLKAIVHTDYYTNPSDTGQIAQYICAHNHLYHLLNLHDDLRFDTYDQAGDSAFFRLNSCAALRFQLWCIKPNEMATRKEKALKYSVHLLFKPGITVLDGLINLSLLVAKVSFLPLYCLHKIFEKLVSNNQVSVLSPIREATLNSFRQLNAFLISSFNILYQTIASISMNFLGPEKDAFFRCSPFYHWAYKVSKITPNDTNRIPLLYMLETTPRRKYEAEMILDLNRVQYLHEKCGWDMNEESLRQYLPKWDPPEPKKSYSYYFEGNQIHVERTDYRYY